MNTLQIFVRRLPEPIDGHPFGLQDTNGRWVYANKKPLTLDSAEQATLIANWLTGKTAAWLGKRDITLSETLPGTRPFLLTYTRTLYKEEVVQAVNHSDAVRIAERRYEEIPNSDYDDDGENSYDVVEIKT